MEAQALLQISNDLMQSQLTRVCSDLTDEQVCYGHEAVDEWGGPEDVVARPQPACAGSFSCRRHLVDAPPGVAAALGERRQHHAQ